MNTDYMKNYPQGVALWTDKIRKINFVLDKPNELKVIHFKKDRTQYIAHSQTEIYKQINIKR